jgi:hypothetical protein
MILTIHERVGLRKKVQSKGKRDNRDGGISAMYAARYNVYFAQANAGSDPDDDDTDTEPDSEPQPSKNCKPSEVEDSVEEVLHFDLTEGTI